MHAQRGPPPYRLITGGELETMDQGYCRVPKKDLICGMQMLMENDELRIAAGMAEAPRLVEEMMEMRVRRTEAMHLLH
ncbi:MAG: hypothetical protein NTY38_32565 [Acidobacteria bacterium]|nr:hypothetical protein [Acidobacteriota bacterium]